MPTDIQAEKALRIATDLLDTVSRIDKLLTEIQNDAMQAMEDQILINKTAEQTAILYSKICNHFNNSEAELDIAFAKVFTFPSRFKRPASLELILSFIYIMVQGYETNLLSPILRDYQQIMYAQRLQKANGTKVAELIHNR